MTARSRGRVAVPVRVWQVGLDVQPSTVLALSSLLTPQERARADRAAEPVRRRRTVLRAALRIVLGRRLGLHPQDVPLAAADGRPRLTGGCDAGFLDVSCSASAGLGLLAVGEGVLVGVDLEVIGGDAAAARRWTATEAVLKAQGTGLTGTLPGPRTVARGRTRVGPWHLVPVTVPGAWTSTLAVGPSRSRSHSAVVPDVLDLEELR